VPLDILVPYWGDPALARQTVQSVLDQRDGDWLLTVVDDAYPDRALGEWMATIDDPRVRYVRKDRNEGITANYRTCVSLATQDRVVILGSDDVLLPDYVGVVLAAHAAHPDVEIIQPGVRVIDGRGEVVRPLGDRVKSWIAPHVRRPTVLRGEPLAVSLLRGDWLYWPSLAFRRDVLERTEFHDDRPLIQDLALVIDVVAAGGALLVEPTVCFSYRRHGASASSTGGGDGARLRGERDYFAAAADQMERRGWRRARRAAAWHSTSRLHALSLVPQAIVRHRDQVPALLAHAFRPAPAVRTGGRR
jgi:glycosyltransferase involved in cell wall biosynthesis